MLVCLFFEEAVRGRQSTWAEGTPSTLQYEMVQWSISRYLTLRLGGTRRHCPWTCTSISSTASDFRQSEHVTLLMLPLSYANAQQDLPFMTHSCLCPQHLALCHHLLGATEPPGRSPDGPLLSTGLI